MRTYATIGIVSGVSFAVWAPNAQGVRVAGDFNFWDGTATRCAPSGRTGIWELFIPNIGTAASTSSTSSDDGVLAREGRPFAFADGGATGDRLGGLHPPTRGTTPTGSTCGRAPTAQRPMSSTRCISVVAGSGLDYRRDPPRSWSSTAEKLGFTHVELLPVTEHPSDPRLGLSGHRLLRPDQPLRHARGFHGYFVDRCHQNGIGVIIDWVPAHFPKDDHGLAPLRRHARCTSTPTRARASIPTGAR